VICPGFVRTPLVAKQIPGRRGISEPDVIKTMMLKETVDGEFTTTSTSRKQRRSAIITSF
jgi:3-hydroxybutyrate dehydrogenase